MPRKFSVFRLKLALAELAAERCGLQASRIVYVVSIHLCRIDSIPVTSLIHCDLAQLGWVRPGNPIGNDHKLHLSKSVALNRRDVRGKIGGSFVAATIF
jgi:hypothetical protein